MLHNIWIMFFWAVLVPIMLLLLFALGFLFVNTPFEDYHDDY